MPPVTPRASAVHPALPASALTGTTIDPDAPLASALQDARPASPPTGSTGGDQKRSVTIELEDKPFDHEMNALVTEPPGYQKYGSVVSKVPGPGMTSSFPSESVSVIASVAVSHMAVRFGPASLPIAVSVVAVLSATPLVVIERYLK